MMTVRLLTLQTRQMLTKREPCSDYIERELNGIVLKNDDLTSDKKVTPSSLKAHLKQLLKNGNLHVGYMTTE